MNPKVFVFVSRTNSNIAYGAQYSEPRTVELFGTKYLLHKTVYSAEAHSGPFYIQDQPTTL